MKKTKCIAKFILAFIFKGKNFLLSLYISYVFLKKNKKLKKGYVKMRPIWRTWFILVRRYFHMISKLRNKKGENLNYKIVINFAFWNISALYGLSHFEKRKKISSRSATFLWIHSYARFAVRALAKISARYVQCQRFVMAKWVDAGQFGISLNSLGNVPEAAFAAWRTLSRCALPPDIIATRETRDGS